MTDKSKISLFIIRNQQLLANSSPQVVAHSKYVILRHRSVFLITVLILSLLIQGIC